MTDYSSWGTNELIAKLEQRDAGTLNPQERKSLNSIISYLWIDEAKDYEASEAPTDHIFEDVIRLQLNTLNYDKDAMYVSSPFDLATEADDVYRDVVDRMWVEHKDNLA